jgi:16S rRNA (guanine527-N7)-methyltransferase
MHRKAVHSLPMDELIAILPEERIRRLRELVDEVLRVNQQFNLTAVRDPDDAWIKHVVDSLQGLRSGLFAGATRVIDIGTGAGFPGLALAIAQPELRLALLEATRKKCDFLRATAEKFGLEAQVICERAEVAGQDAAWRETFDVATARAVGSLSEVCELALPLVKTGGHLVLWRGEKASEEMENGRRALATLGAKFETLLPYRLPGHEPEYHLVVIKKMKPTPSRFPRRVGLPKQRPL